MSFDQFVVLRNPISTDAHRTQKFIKELQRLFPEKPIEIIDTVPGGLEPNAAVFKSKESILGPRTLLCIGGGDGTVNLVVNALLGYSSLSENARLTPILPLWAGNANDLACMLNGSGRITSLSTIFKKGKVVAVRPLVCELRFTNGQSSVYYASNYASFGASGFAIKKLERSLRRKSPMKQFAISRFGIEFVEVARLLMRAPHFWILENDIESLIFERIFLNGSRFAKVAAAPLKLTENRFHRATVNRRNLPTIIFRLAELMRDRAGRKVGSVHDNFTVLDRVWAQFDGEPVRVPAGTAIDIKLADTPIYAFATRQ